MVFYYVAMQLLRFSSGFRYVFVEVFRMVLVRHYAIVKVNGVV